MDLNIPALDLDTESQGKWFKYLGTIELKIARMNNEEFLAAAVARLSEESDDFSETDTKEQESFMIQLYSKHILKDWRGVKDGETDLPYTPEIGYAILKDSKYKDMLLFLMRKSKDITQYWEKQTSEVGEK